MITLKIIKAILPVCDVKNFDRAFRQWGFFLLKVKIQKKRKLDSWFFYGENNSKIFKNNQVIWPESPPLSNEVGLQFLIYLLSIYLFSNSLITACLRDILKQFLDFKSFKELEKAFLISHWKVSQNFSFLKLT